MDVSSTRSPRWRARLRLGARLGLAASLALAIAGLLVERHRPCASRYHPGVEHVFGPPRAILSDLPPAPLVLLAAALFAQALAARTRPLIAAALDLAAAGAALVALMSLAWIHARAHTIGDTFIAAPALLAAAAIGLALPLVELWLARPAER